MIQTHRCIMRVYHFVCAKHGIENLCCRRLKIATINELNDPFELLAINLADSKLRRALAKAKRQLAAKKGILCFSRRRKNPVLWSHYAAKHTGLCLGFDIPSEHLIPVQYIGKRIAVEAEQKLQLRDMDEATVLKFLRTKYAHWHYEAEMRVVKPLKKCVLEEGLYFADFSDELVLKDVIVGANSMVSRSDLAKALGDLGQHVRSVKARLAFKTFNVVSQHKSELWR